MGEPVSFDNTYARLPETFFARVRPAAVPAPTLVRLNRGLCEQLGVDARWLESEAGVAMLAGNALPESADSIAMAYAGHQFGGWVPRLGDGRALLLGEVVDGNGIRRDVQLKGSGATPFSRGGDGKATLGAILREYIVSEAMFALGIPTTRALAAVMTGEPVFRETPVPGAILTRVARSHVRVGTFQYFHARNDERAVRTLADYVAERHYPRVFDAGNPYRALLDSIVERQAELVARWMHVGFIHGVMNTDNMQVAGETIDYGPCAFMDQFRSSCVFSSIDRNGRYAWDQQPAVARWNLARLAESLLPLLSVDEANAALVRFGTLFDAAYLDGFRQKLGLTEPSGDDDELLRATLATLGDQDVDFTLFFRRLTQVAAGADDGALVRLFNSADRGRAWLATWRERLQTESTDAETRAAIMRGVNPIVIPRNHRIEAAIQAGNRGDFTPFHRLVDVLSSPYEERPDYAEYESAPLPEQRVLQTFCGT